MVGMVFMPVSIGEFEIGWTATTFGFAWSAGHGDGVGTAVSAIGAGAAIAALIVCPPAGAAAAAIWY